MKVLHFLAAVIAVVQHDAVAGAVEFECGGGRGDGPKKAARCSIGPLGQFGKSGDSGFGNDQDVNGRLGCDIAEGQDIIVFVDDIGGYFSGNNFIEDCRFGTHKRFLKRFLNGVSRDALNRALGGAVGGVGGAVGVVGVDIKAQAEHGFAVEDKAAREAPSGEHVGQPP